MGYIVIANDYNGSFLGTFDTYKEAKEYADAHNGRVIEW